MRELEDRLGVVFQNQALLTRALTHKSFGKQHGGSDGDNERLEFFGDSVLKFVVSEYLFREFPDQAEGPLTKLRGYIISDQVLGELGAKLGLGESIRLSSSEKRSGGAGKSSILGNAVEALLGAVYLDQGMDAARDFILGAYLNHMPEVFEGGGHVDAKSDLQEKLQGLGEELPIYEVLEEMGPEHDKMFLVRVCFEIGRKRFAFEGEGKTKKLAEQDAAGLGITSLG